MIEAVAIIENIIHSEYAGCKIIAIEPNYQSQDKGYVIAISQRGLTVWWEWALVNGKPFYHHGKITK